MRRLARLAKGREARQHDTSFASGDLRSRSWSFQNEIHVFDGLVAASQTASSESVSTLFVFFTEGRRSGRRFASSAKNCLDLRMIVVGEDIHALRAPGAPAHHCSRHASRHIAAADRRPSSSLRSVRMLLKSGSRSEKPTQSDLMAEQDRLHQVDVARVTAQLFIAGACQNQTARGAVDAAVDLGKNPFLWNCPTCCIRSG